jgi:hypothetical protein
MTHQLVVSTVDTRAYAEHSLLNESVRTSSPEDAKLYPPNPVNSRSAPAGVSTVNSYPILPTPECPPFPPKEDDLHVFWEDSHMIMDQPPSNSS